MKGRAQLLVAALLTGCAAAPAADPGALQRQVLGAERAFAQTMAARDHAAFTAFLSEEAVFFSGATPLRGRTAIADGWKKFFEGPQAPFSWEPDQVEVLDSGTLAHSSGPVRDQTGTTVARFNSVWRQEAPGVWRVVFDRGCDACPQCPPTEKPQ